MFFDDTFIAVNLVYRPRADDAGIAPGGCAVAHRDLTRRHIGKRSFRALRIFEVNQPLGEKCCDVHIVSRRADENLGVAGPAQPFIALWAVGRHLDKVAPLAPYYISV